MDTHQQVADAGGHPGTALGARGPVLQRSTATVEPESALNGLHQACEAGKTPSNRVAHSSHSRGHWLDPGIAHQAETLITDLVTWARARRKGQAWRNRPRQTDLHLTSALSEVFGNPR